MDQSKFKEIEQKYKDLIERLNYGILNPNDVKEELKKMMVLDEEGKYWMIGAKTGKWYTHDGTEWREGNPYEKEQEPEEPEDINGTISLSLPGTDSVEREESQEEETRVKVEALEDEGGQEILAEEEEAPVKVEMFEDRAGEDILAEKEEEPAVDVIHEEAGQKEILAEEKEAPVKVEMFEDKAGEDILLEVKEEDKTERYAKKEEAPHPRKAVKTKMADVDVEKKEELVITSIKVMPLIFFLGGLGLILGVLLGAAFGIFKTILPTLQEQIPDILNDTRGKIPGGLVFAAIGGIGGFFISAAAALIISSTYKLIASIFGGIRLKIKQ